MIRKLLPREKALRLGIGSLTEEELLSLILSVGTSRLNVFSLARKLLTEFSLKELAQLPPKALMQIEGIGEAKAIRLAAAFELGRRLYSLPDDDLNHGHLRSLLFKIAHKRKEILLLSMYDSNGRFLGSETIAMGRYNVLYVHPREIFEPLFKNGASRFILAHNHPSGDPQPSAEDLKFSERMDSLARELDLILLESFVVIRDRAVGILNGTVLLFNQL
ncbi:MAG: DNA repair protein RadC [Thermotogae bacterium]|nr:DNA repair protein RadC [Thermotogota bacterium]